MLDTVLEYKAIIAIASIFCLVGVFLEFKNSADSAWVSSPLALPFYVAGIVQWMFAALVFGSFSVLITCLIQLFFLSPIIAAYISNKR
jgi:hypothetical protein